VNSTVIVSLDEPYLSAFGSAFISLSREQIITALEECFSGLTCLKAVHCCGNTDWSVVLETSVQILSLDAYAYAESLSLYPEAVRAFLQRSGIIAWELFRRMRPGWRGNGGWLLERLETAWGLLTPRCPAGRLLAAAWSPRRAVSATFRRRWQSAGWS